MKTPRAELADVERDVTIVVKTFERPESLRRLVTSIMAHYPRVPILVVDDSEHPLEPPPSEITRYFHLPYNTLGVSAGRNYGWRKVETPYAVICDDDMVFERRTDLGRMLATLRSTRFGVVSCKCFEHDPWRSVALGFRRFEGSAEIVDGTLVRRLGESSGTVDRLPVYDVVAQFFMAERQALGDDPWDPSLRVAVEHVELFLQLKRRGVLSTMLPDVVVQHHPRLPPRYYDIRMKGREDSFRIWAKQRGFEEKVFEGRSFPRRDRLRYYYPSLASYALRRGRAKILGKLRAASRHGAGAG
jgi:hypothetical protein